MKKTVSYFILLLAILLLQSVCVHAQYEFVENKGQWHENVNYKMDIQFGAIFLEDNTIAFNFVGKEELNFSSAHHGAEGSSTSLIRNAHSYKVVFKNSNKEPQIKEEGKTSDYCNYYIGNDRSKWASYVSKFRKINYFDIYDNIDISYYTYGPGMKYDLIVHPGGNIKDVDMEYQGADMIFIEDGELVISTSVNVVRESKPYAYQVYGTDTVEVECNYTLKRNRVGFEVDDSYDKSKELIIDPSLVFSTYSGSTGDNWGFTATWDYDDNVYSGGIVFMVGYPTTVGAYQQNFAGGTAPPNSINPNYMDGCDVGIIKYNETGTMRLFATYLGGAGGQEMPHSLVVTEANELVIMGTTGSSDFPVSTGAFSTTFSGGDSIVYDNVIAFPNGIDIFVSKLSEDGTQYLGGTYIGGSGNDGLNYQAHFSHPAPGTNINFVEMHGNDSLYFNYGDGARGEVIVDNKNMIYVGTNTFSSDFPSGINPGFQASSGGKQDGIVFKLTSNLSQMLWSSYMGGGEDDAIFSLSLTEDEDVIVAGGAVSQNFPTTTGAYNTVHNGGSTDAFISKINMDGNTLLSSSFFGSNVYDNAFFVRTDRFNNVFICGQTKASGSTLVSNASYSNPNSGQFIAKFNSDITNLEWSTVFGSGNGRPNISITAFAVDVCDRVYLSGWGREWTSSYYNSQGNYYTWESTFGTMGMPLTPDAIQNQTDGQDFYVLVLNEDASNLEYASFFGELHYGACGASGRDHVDGGTSRFDKKGHIIQSVCASCGGCQQFPTSPSPGAWSNTNNATNCNNAVFKIRIIENLAEANFDPIPIACAPITVDFNNTSQGTTFVWDFGDGSPESTDYNPSHTYTEGGEYTVSLIVGDPLSCNFYDTIIRIITVVEPGQSNLPDLEICPGENVIVGPEGSYPDGTTFLWVEGSNLNYNNIQNPVASPDETDDYLLIATGVCIDSTWQHIVVYEPEFDLMVSNDTLICPGGEADLFASTSGGVDSWQWSSDPGFNTILSTSQSLLASPTNNTTYYVRAQEDLCNTYLTEQVMVTLHQFNYWLDGDHILCPGNTTNLAVNNQSATDVLSYSWEPIAQIISGETTSNPLVGPLTNTTYFVTITNQMGCTTTDQVDVTIDNIIFNTPTLVHNPCFDYCEGSASVSAIGIPPYTYEWNNSETESTISDLCADSYTVTVTDDHGCTTETEITIIEPPELDANFINVTDPACDGVGYGSATISPVGGTPPYTYVWTFGGSQATNNNCLVGDNVVNVTDANGCTSEHTVNMPAPGSLTSSLDDFTLVDCYGNCNGTINVSANLGTPPYQYNWSSTLTGGNLTNLCPGAYTCTIVDDENCVSHQYIYITQPDTLITNAQINDEILCFGELGDIGLLTTGGTQPYSYTWSTGSTDNQLNDVVAGDYLITVIDINNCEDHSVVSLIEPPEIYIDSTLRNQMCNNVCNGYISAEVIGGVQPYYYDWSNGSQQSHAEELCSGDYSLTMHDSNNCTHIRDYTIINEGYVPDLAVGASSEEVFAGEQVGLLAESTQTGSYSWNNGDLLNHDDIPNPVAILFDSTLMRVVFRDENNCIAVDTVFIRVKEVICGDPYIYVPNAFTPDADGLNDYFKPYYPLNLVTEVYFAVFDRWGNIIYETTDLDANGWDGTYKGEVLSTDVYVFWLRARCLNGEEYNHKGNVTLLR